MNTSNKIRNAQKRWRQGRIIWEKLQQLMLRYKLEAPSSVTSINDNS